MSQKQQTIKNPVSFSGAGLHTGHRVHVRLKPALENTGIQFVRTDMPGSPAIKADPDNVRQDPKVSRCTTIGIGDAVIHTVEHLMSVLAGLGIDNLVIELDGDEIPGLDGSAAEFLSLIKKAGLTEQPADRNYFVVTEPVGVNSNGASILIVPDSEFKISYTLDYAHPLLQSQFFTTAVNATVFERDIAPSRTFCLEQEAQELQKMGLGQGANYQNTLVVGDNGVIQNKVRFPNEFARHKVLDCIGDLYLLGRPIKGHVFAVKSGHRLNLELLKKLIGKVPRPDHKGYDPDYRVGDAQQLDIHQIMKILPHRYPFLLVDRILELKKGEKSVGIKNVTINDNFFCGHFPSRPVMPGVLMVEALAQTAGVLLMTNENHHGKVAMFMAVEHVKFRKVVGPGDQLVLEAVIGRDRSRTAMVHGKAMVNGEVVAEADLLFSFIDASFLD